MAGKCTDDDDALDVVVGRRIVVAVLGLGLIRCGDALRLPQCGLQCGEWFASDIFDI